MSPDDLHERPPRQPGGTAHRHPPSWPAAAVAAAAVLATIVGVVIVGVVAWQPWAADDARTPGSPVSSSGSLPADPIPATGYHVRDSTHLAIVYANGVPECYGTAGTPLVEETADAVTVTIPRVGVATYPPGDKEEGRACIDIALLDSVEITLDAPLDGRTVRDGSRGGAVLGPQSLPGADGT